MKNKHLVLSLLIVLLTFSCSKDDDNSTTQPINEIDQVAFLLYDLADDTYSTYYKGEVSSLNSPNGNVIIKSISKEGNDVYTAGSQKINDIWNVALWKNSILDTNTPINNERCYIEAIDVDNGNIYLAGRRVYDDRIDAAYWMNNTYNVLAKSKDNALANAIKVDNNLIAIAGQQYQTLGPTNAAAWENNTIYEINGTEVINNIAQCVYNDGSNPIYGGYKLVENVFAPIIWDKNGPTSTYTLPTGKSGIIIKLTKFQNAIYTLINTNISVNDSQTRAVELWKNGVFQETIIEVVDENVLALFLGEINGKLYYAASSDTSTIFKTFDETLSLPINVTQKKVIGMTY